MNEIGYQLIVDKRIKRKIDILSHLLRATSPIRINTLAEKCQVSTKTISAEIKALNEELPDSIYILSNATLDGYSLISDNPFKLNNFIAGLSVNNPLYIILDSIFYHNHQSLEDFSIELFLSESTIRSYLNILSNVLESYSLTLRITPYIDILGNEVDIRFFFFNYFRYGAIGSEKFHKKEIYELTHKNVKEALKNFENPLSFDYFRLYQWLLIFEQRIASRNFVNLPDSLLKKHQSTKSYKVFLTIYNDLFESHPILKNVSDHELMYVYLTQLDCLVYETGTFYYREDYLDWLAPFESVVDIFFRKQRLRYIISMDLKILLQAFLSNTMVLSEITPFFQRVNSSISSHVKLHYADIYKDWLVSLNKSFPEKLLFPEDIAVSLTMLSVSYLDIQNKHQINLLFSLSGSPSSLGYFKTTLLSMIPRGINTHFVFNKPVNDELLSALEIDFCIYNYYIDEPLHYCKSLRLSNIPTEIEWLSIVKQLFFTNDKLARDY